MEPSSPAPETTASSPEPAGLRREPWTSVRSLSASKPCAVCGSPVIPWRKERKGKVHVMTEPQWNAQVCCSISCGKKSNNPMGNSAIREKVSRTLKRIGHKPPVRRGNGTVLSLPQLAIWHALGETWEVDFPVTVGMGRGNGYPTHFKLDLAHPASKTAFEFDGQSHGVLSRQEQDARKMAKLAELGWSVFRVSNERALHLYSTFTSADTLLTSLKAS